MGIASALVVNAGNMSAEWVGSMKLAAMKCRELGKPWVLDPVGAGATLFRTQVPPPPLPPSTHIHTLSPTHHPSPDTHTLAPTPQT